MSEAFDTRTKRTATRLVVVVAIMAVPVALQFALPSAWWVLPFLLMLIGIAASGLHGGWISAALATVLATGAILLSASAAERAFDAEDLPLLMAGAGALAALTAASTRRARLQSDADHAALRRQMHERAAAELRLGASEQRFRTFIDALPDTLFTADADGRAHLLGTSWIDAPAGATEAVDLFGAVHAEDVDAVRQRWATAVAMGRMFDVRCRLRARDGGFRWALLRAQGSGAAALHGHSWFGVIVDVDRQAEAERALRETDERLHLALDATGLGLWDYDFGADAATCSQRVYTILGLPEGTRIDHTTWHALVFPDDEQHVVEHVRLAIANACSIAGSETGDRAATLDLEYRVRRASDGAVRWVALTGRIACERRGTRVQLRRATGTLRDVTRRREAVERLRSSEERLALAQHAGGIGMFDWDVATNALTCSRTEEMILGLAPAEGPRTYADLNSLVHPADRERVDATLRDALDSERAYSDVFRIVRRGDGAERWISAQATITRSDSDAPVRMTGVHRDITDERVAEQRLQASEERFRLAAEALDGLIYDYDPATDHVERSRGLRRVTGFDIEDVPPTGAWWRGRVHRDDLMRVAATLDRARDERALRVEQAYRIRHRDGHFVHVNDSAFMVWRDGVVVRRVGVVTDVTDRRRIERVLRDADRRKDEFLAVLAHELRNPLAPVRNAAQVITRASDRQVVAAAARLLERQVSQMVRLIDDLLDVSRIAQGKLRLRRMPASLTSIVDAAVEIAQPMIEARQQAFARRLPANDVTLDADAVRLSQVIANLLHNASKYTPSGGSIALTAEVDAEASAIEVRVADNGVGIEARSLETIFTMFSQLPATADEAASEPTRHDGLGIGLALARAVVSLHGGTLRAESEGLGRGSQFVLTLPLGTAPAPNRAVEAPSSDETSRWRVLVVDDNRDAAESLAAMLRLDNHEVYVAYGGREALRVAERERPDLVLLDIGMPDLDGYEVARLMRASEASPMRIVALSGYGQVSDREKSIGAGCDAHLVKPVALADLAAWLVRDSEGSRSG